MKPTRKLTRRSFLGRVAGGVVGGAALLATGTQEAEALQVSDRDSGSNADPAGRGYTGYSDSDTGRGSDRVNHGRRGRRGGRRGIQGCTDNDRGSNADPGGRGRGSGYSDSDGGRNSDPAGCGRR